MTKKTNKTNKKKNLIDIPENFKTILFDFFHDLSKTFPEYKELWSKYSTLESITSEVRTLFDYFITVFPERFSDILYQNEDIFKPESTINTFFLPNIDFKILYNCNDITETTKKAIWKYLQIILFTIMNSVRDKSKFGEAMNLFEGINDKELQEKLSETMKDITDFFSNISHSEKNGEPYPNLEKMKEQFSHMFEGGEPPNLEKIKEQFSHMFGGNPDMKDEFSNMFEGDSPPDMTKIEEVFASLFEKMKDSEKKDSEKKDSENKNSEKKDSEESQKNPFANMPDPNNLHEHLKKLFDGKIGRLAKELAEELSGDLTSMFKEDGVDIKTSQDVLKHIIKNPKKMMELVKTIGTKLTSKIQSGEISQEEMMREASELMSQMKNMGGKDQFSEILKNMTKNMGGMGKNAKIDMNALSRLEKQMSTKDRIRKNVELKRQEKEQEQKFKIDPNVKVEKKDSTNNLVFKIGEEKQEKSEKINEEIDDLITKLDLKNESITTVPVAIKKKNKNKKK